MCRSWFVTVFLVFWRNYGYFTLHPCPSRDWSRCVWCMSVYDKCAWVCVCACHVHVNCWQWLFINLVVKLYPFYFVLCIYMVLYVADRNNDRSTINRKLTESLFLVVKRNRQDNAWQFPQGKWAEGETMRQVKMTICYKSCINQSIYYSLFTHTLPPSITVIMSL